MQLAIQEPYMLTIQPDDFFISPRRLDENFGTMICFHRRYDLGDEHNYGDNEDFLKDLYTEAPAGAPKLILPPLWTQSRRITSFLRSPKGL